MPQEQNNAGIVEKLVRWTSTHRLIVLLLVILFFIAYTGLLLAPRTTDMKGRIHAGPDPKNIVWSMMWGHRALLNDPAHFFRANIYYPHQDSFAYSDMILVPSLLTLPFRLFTSEPTVLFNISYWITYAMAGVFMFLLVRQLTRNDVIALLCGIFYAFSPYRLDNITHLQYAQHQWLPLMVLFLVLFFQRKKFIYALGLALTTAATALSCGAYMVMSIFPFAMLVVLLLIARKITLKQFGILVLGGIIALAAFGPFYYVTYSVVKDNRIELSHDNRVVFAPDVLDFFKQPKYMTSAPYALLPEKIKTPYFSLFPGFVAGLAIFAGLLFYFRRVFRIEPEEKNENGKLLSWLRASRWAVVITLALLLLSVIWAIVLPPETGVRDVNGYTLIFVMFFLSLVADATVSALARRKELISTASCYISIFTFLAFTAALLSLGPFIFINTIEVGANIFLIFNSFIPGLAMVRQVMHYNTFFMLFMIPAAAVALEKLVAKAPRLWRIVLYASVVLLVAFEYQTDLSKDFAEVPTEPVETYVFLNEEGPRSPIIELPMWDYPHQPEADRHFWSMFHWNPMVNGWFSYFPLDYYQTLDHVLEFPTRASIEYIQDNYMLRFIVVRLSHYSGEQREEMLRLFEQEWSTYKLTKQFKYFWIFENQKWKDEYYYNTEPPEITGPVRKRY